jgi:16S rRNA G1207 methylase RsmC
MSLAEPEPNNRDGLVASLREEMKTQVAAAVLQAKKETSEQHVRIAQALAKLTAERDKTLQGVISALEREVAESKKTILELQAAASEKTSAAHDCAQVRTGHQTDASTQTLPERMGISDEEIKAIIDLAVAPYEQEFQGQRAVFVD